MSKSIVTFKELKTINFKSLPDNVTIPFTKKTVIEGPNGVGKTSIQQALMACFTGLTVTGKNSLEDYKRDQRLPLAISTVLSVEQNGNNLKCAARIELKSNKKTFFFNNKVISHSKLLEKFKIEKPKHFMASISPMFTMSLSNSEMVELITESNSDRVTLAKKYLNAKELTKVEVNNIDDSLKKIRAKRLKEQKEIANLENEISFLNGQLDGIKTVMPNEVNYNAKDHKETEKALKAHEKIEQIKSEINEKLTKFKEVMLGIEGLNQDEEKVEKSAEILTSLKEEEKSILNDIKKMEKIKRPALPKAYQEKIKKWEMAIKEKNELEKKLSSNMANQENHKSVIENFNPNYNKDLEKKKKEYISRRDSYLVKKAKEIEDLETITKKQPYKEIQERFFLLNNAKKSKTTLKSSKPIKDKINELSSSLNRKTNAYINLKELEKKIKDLPKQELRERASEINALFPKNAHISIQVSGDDKPILNISKNGHSFNWLSSSEKSKIMGVISGYIADKSGIPFKSMFIDNAEMFSSDIKGLTNQTIIAKVGNNKKLSINGKEI